MRGKQNRYSPNYFFVSEGGCSCNISVYKTHIFVSSLMTEMNERRKGYGTLLVKRIVRIGRKLGIPIKLVAAPYGREHLGLPDTIKFYEKCGLKQTGWGNSYSQEMSTNAG